MCMDGSRYDLPDVTILVSTLETFDDFAKLLIAFTPVFLNWIFLDLVSTINQLDTMSSM